MYKKIILYIIIITLFLSVVFLYTDNKQLEKQNFTYKRAMFVYSYKHIQDCQQSLNSVYEKFEEMSNNQIVNNLTRVNNMLIQVESNLSLLRNSYNQDTLFLSYLFYLYSVEIQDLILKLDKNHVIDKDLIKSKLKIYMEDFNTISVAFHQYESSLQNTHISELKEFAQSLLSQLKAEEVIKLYNEYFNL